MNRRILIGLVALGALGLSSGCLVHPHYRYPVAYAAANRPGSFWTGVGLSAAGNTVLRSAHNVRDPGTALAVAAVGLGLHAVAAGCYYDAAAAPPRHYRPCSSRYRSHRRHDHYYYPGYGYR